MVNYDHMYDKDYFQKEFEIDHFAENKLSYTVYENAYIVPFMGDGTGVYRENKEFIGSTALHNGNGVPLDRDCVNATKCLDDTVVYLGIMSQTWGHTITDVIRRLWFLKSSDYLEKYKNCKLVLLSGVKEKKVEQVYELLNILGLEESQIDASDCIAQYRKVIIPDDCFWLDEEKGQRYFTSEYRALIAEVNDYQAKNFKPDKSCERLYFSHGESGKIKRSIGEKKLEKFFESQGYRVIYPEKHSLREQLNMLANCRYFASTIGSGSHNIVFLPKHADVILIPRAWYLTGYQTALNQVIDLNIYYVDSSLSVLARWDVPWCGPHYYFVSENLCRFFGIMENCDNRFYKKQLSDLGKYLKLEWTYEDLSDRCAPEYYMKQFAYYKERMIKAHPYRSLFWLCVLCGPGRIKRTLKRIIGGVRM